MSAFALSLRVLAWWQAAVFAAIGLTMTVGVLPKLAGPHLYLPFERPKRFRSSLVLYAVAILTLVLVLFDRLDIVAAAWGILAWGDGMATVVGRRIGGPSFPWNREKTLAGSAAFVVCGGAAGALLAWWCRPAVLPPPYLWFSIGAPIVAALAAAGVETIPIRLPDNLSVPFTAAATLWAVSLVSEDLAVSAAARFAAALPLALAANVAVASIGYLARTVSRSGAVAGVVIGVVVLLSTGWSGWALLLITFAAAALSSRLGLHRKTMLGIAEPHGGRRGAGNAVANTGVAAAAALLAVLSYAEQPALIAFVAALAAGGADTIASEIGKAYGRRTFLITTLRRVPPGTSGALSFEGTAAGICGALALAAAGAALGLIGARAILPVAAGATAGTLAESVLGAALEHRGVLNNDVLNFVTTAVAAYLAIWLAA